jgi:hypothetical protein
MAEGIVAWLSRYLAARAGALSLAKQSTVLTKANTMNSGLEAETRKLASTTH